MLDVSQSADADRYSRYALEYPLKCPLVKSTLEYFIRGLVCEGLGAGAPVGAGADESASLRLIKTARLPICKRRPTDNSRERQVGRRHGGRPESNLIQVNHIEWLIRT